MNLNRAVRPWVAAAFAVFALVVMEGWRARVSAAASAAAARAAEAQSAVLELERTRDGIREQSEMKARDLARFKDGLEKLTQSRRTLFEAGLQLQEEKRQLEKLWELLTTYVLADLAEGRISLMRGDQALSTFPSRFSGAPETALTRIVSRERFAGPERGKAEASGTSLDWKPPQAGVRADALGEFVLFTDSALILHGPAKDAKAHAAYPHLCAGLTQWAAGRLYEKTFIGTKILLRR